MAISVVSFDGHDINDGVNYRAWMVAGEGAYQREVSPILHTPHRRHPIIIRSDKRAARFPLHIALIGEDMSTRRDELTRWFAKDTEGLLVVTFGTTTRAMTCRVVKTMPFDGSAAEFAVEMLAADPRWRSFVQQCFTSGGLQFTGDFIDSDVRELNEEGDGLPQNYQSVGIHVSSTNLLTNGGAETNTTGWTPGGTNSLSRTTADSYFGSACFQAQYSNALNMGLYAGATLDSNSTYALSGWVYIRSPWSGGDIGVDQSGFTDTVNVYQVKADASLTDQWQRVWCQIDTDATSPGSGNIRVRADSAPSSLQSIRFDGMQLEKLVAPTPYIETDGATASRTAATIEASASSMSASQGWVAVRCRFGFSNDTSGVTSLSNRYLFQWYDDNNNKMDLFYQDSALGTDAWKFERYDGGLSDTRSIAGSAVEGEEHTVIATWEDGRIRMSLDGAAFVNATGSNAPALTSGSFWIGCNATGSGQWWGDIYWITTGSGLLTDDDAAAIHLAGGGQPNVLRQTEKFQVQAFWTKTSGSTVTADDGDAPDGLTTGDTWTTGTAAGQLLRQDTSLAAVNTEVWSGSLYVKARRTADIGVKVLLRVGDTNSSSTSATTYTLTNAWQRITHTHTFNGSASGSVRFQLDLHPDNEGVANKVLVWGAQLESGSTVTDYVPVTFGNDVPTLWPDDSGKCFEWNADTSQTSPYGFTTRNNGTATEDAPVLTVRPISAKAAADSWIYKREVIIANRVPNAFADYAVCLTDDGASGGWDHAAEVTAGRSLSSGDDVRVLVDGVETPRWVGTSTAAWNNIDTLIWVNLSMSPGLIIDELDAAITAGSPATGGVLEVKHGSTEGFPESGALLIDDEVIEYTGKNSHQFTGITRGARNTTAASHSATDSVYFVERRVQIIYGYTGASAPDDRDERKPMIDLTNSTNDAHQWTEFTSSDPRSMQWQRVLRDRDRQRDKILAPVTETPAGTVEMALEYQSKGPTAGKPNYNGWLMGCPAGTKNPTGTFCSSTVSVPARMILNSYVVDGDGNEILFREQLSASGTMTLANGADPFYSVEFSGRNGVVVSTPTSTESGPTTITTGGAQMRQVFTVPPSLDGPAYIDAVIPELRVLPDTVGTEQADFFVQIAKEDPDSGSWVTLLSESKSITSSGGYQQLYTEFTSQLQVYPGDQIAVQIELDAFAAGGTSLRWQTYNQSFEGGTTAKSLRVISNSLDHSEDALGTDGSEITVDGVGITYDSAGIPYVNMLGQESIYWLNGQFSNDTTGQTIDLAVAVALEDEVEINVANRSVRNVTAGESIFWAATFSDENDWIEIVPGLNEWTYTESGLTGGDVSVDWYSRWES